MTGQLHPDGFSVERFYAEDVGEFYDELGSMLHFALPDHSEGLQHHDCIHQLLNGVDGRFIRLFGGLERIKGKLDEEGFRDLSLGVSKSFYLLKWEDYDGFAQAINGLDDVLKASVQRKKMANDA
jgi:hypothetical protein